MASNNLTFGQLQVGDRFIHGDELMVKVDERACQSVHGGWITPIWEDSHVRLRDDAHESSEESNLQQLEDEASSESRGNAVGSS